MFRSDKFDGAIAGIKVLANQNIFGSQFWVPAFFVVSTLYAGQWLADAALRHFSSVFAPGADANVQTVLRDLRQAPASTVCTSEACTISVQALDAKNVWGTSVRWLMPELKTLRPPPRQVFKFSGYTAQNRNYTADWSTHGAPPATPFQLSGLYSAPPGFTVSTLDQYEYKKQTGFSHLFLDTPALLLNGTTSGGRTFGSTGMDMAAVLAQPLHNVTSWANDLSGLELTSVRILPIPNNFQLQFAVKDADFLKVGLTGRLSLQAPPGQQPATIFSYQGEITELERPSVGSDAEDAKLVTVVFSPNKQRRSAWPEWASYSDNTLLFGDALRSDEALKHVLSRLVFEIDEIQASATKPTGRANTAYRVLASHVLMPTTATTAEGKPSEILGEIWVVVEGHLWPVQVEVSAALANSPADGHVIVRERADLQGLAVPSRHLASLSPAARGQLRSMSTHRMLVPGAKIAVHPSADWKANQAVKIRP